MRFDINCHTEDKLSGLDAIQLVLHGIKDGQQVTCLRYCLVYSRYLSNKSRVLNNLLSPSDAIQLALLTSIIKQIKSHDVLWIGLSDSLLNPSVCVFTIIPVLPRLRWLLQPDRAEWIQGNLSEGNYEGE